MVQVDIMVNDRVYKVTCEDGQEERLQQLAAHFDRHVRDMARELGQIGDARLMLLSALTVCDELFEARAAIEDMEQGGEPLDPATVGGASRVIDAAAKRVEGIAKKMTEAA
jgi:cell division protein ZapA